MLFCLNESVSLGMLLIQMHRVISHSSSHPCLSLCADMVGIVPRIDLMHAIPAVLRPKQSNMQRTQRGRHQVCEGLAGVKV